MYADAKLGVKGRFRQMQLMRHASFSMQCMLRFESMSPQLDKRQKLIGSKGVGKDSTLAQLRMQTKTQTD